MRAIILVGGRGTRLRPLTNNLPKALVPVGGRPLVEYLLQHLSASGIREVTVATTYQNRAIEARFGGGEALGMDLTYAYETQPLGSGGAIVSAAAGWNETFLAVNGDIISDIDISDFVQLHADRAAAITLALYSVADPSRYGVVASDETGRITQFVEKPSSNEAPSTWINAGYWLFEPAALSQITTSKFTRVEDELFPQIADRQGAIFGFQHEGYWLDVGTLQTYHQANIEMLMNPHKQRPGASSAGANAPVQSAHRFPDVNVTEPVHVEPSSVVRRGATLHGPLAIGSGCVIGEGAVLRDSVIWDQATIGAGAIVERSIVATGASVGSRCRIRNCVIPPGSTINQGETPDVTF